MAMWHEEAMEKTKKKIDTMDPQHMRLGLAGLIIGVLILSFMTDSGGGRVNFIITVYCFISLAMVHIFFPVEP